jgi:uncharacterized SAM-binding protein YcdF (DUF218 family)
MIRTLLGLGIVIIAAIVGISLYLQPDDLKSCNEVVSGIAPCQKVDAIVAVSGGDTNARTDEAIALYNKGWSDILIFSGAAQDKSGPSNAAAMKDHAKKAGIPSSAIQIDESSETTRQNAEYSKTIFDSLKIKTIILVTSGYHQKRASLEYAKRASEVIVFNHSATSDPDWNSWWWANPRGWTLATSELFKIVLFNFGVSR